MSVRQQEVREEPTGQAQLSAGTAAIREGRLRNESTVSLPSPWSEAQVGPRTGVLPMGRRVSRAPDW
jgi:hypothetical protein